jgi:hypothetical protein
MRYKTDDKGTQRQIHRMPPTYQRSHEVPVLRTWCNRITSGTDKFDLADFEESATSCAR